MPKHVSKFRSAFDALGGAVTPGQILDFHRATFGDARMEDDAEAAAAAAKAATEKAAADAKAKDAADKAAAEKGYPDETPVEEMTSAQQAAYWKAQSRKHEDRAKSYGGLTPEALKALQEKATKHDALERELMSDKDKAVAEATDKANAAAIPRVVKAEFKAAAKGVLSADQLKALLEDRDLTKYVDANGDPDETKIENLVKAFAPAKPAGRVGPTAQGLGGRHGGGNGGDQASRQLQKRGLVKADKAS